jgi:hypothetical protein
MKRPTFFLFAALTLAAAVLAWRYSRRPSAQWRPALSARETATRVLARHLAGQFPGAKALVFGNPFTLRSGQSPEIYEFEQAGLRGVEEGFGKPASIKIVYPDLRPAFLQRPGSVYIDPKTTTPLSFLVSENAFDELFEANPGYSLGISLIGVPVGIRERRVWLDPEKPHFGLLLPDWRLVGGRDAIVAAFGSGKISAAVVPRPGPVSLKDASHGTDAEAEFNRQFLLVTKENVKEMVAKHPEAF